MPHPPIPLAAAALCCLMSVAAVARAEPHTWTVRGNVPLESFVVQAHRGAGELAEENSLEAFQLGWTLNCIPEADVRTTRDGVIVAFHDKDFSRVVKDVSPDMAKKGVKDVTFHELQKLDIGSFKGDAFVGRRAPRMSQIFALLTDHPDRRLYLDIKDVDLETLAGEVKQARVEKQVIFASTKYDQHRAWRKLIPDGQTLLWMGGTEAKLSERFEELRKTNFADVTQVQIHTRLPDGVKTIDRGAKDPFTLSDRFLIDRGDEVRKHGILYQTLPWGGATREVYWKLLDLGFMSFATDHPEVTWAAIRDYYREGK